METSFTYKVRGFCSDKSNPEVFDDVNVYGNIYNSDIHHNNFGLYTYGEARWNKNVHAFMCVLVCIGISLLPSFRRAKLPNNRFGLFGTLHPCVVWQLTPIRP